ncbi:MAG TPA: hypothetical protein VKR06_10990 [Ktedonosporobacter sp.]|nr:hypothetical protein [Ktedonosporobacter sp.]
MEQKSLLDKLNSVSVLTWIDDDGNTVLNIPLWVVLLALLLLVGLRRRGRRARR